MSYKTILVHADLSPHAEARYAMACELARCQQAHLTGAAMSGLNMELLRNASLAMAEPLAQEDIDVIRANTGQALDRFEDHARRAGISYERRSSDDDAESGLVQQACYADLVVLSQTDPVLGGPAILRKLPEHVVLYGGRPVLLVPYAGEHALPSRHALVAWDGSRAATRAITGALPLLARCARVTLAVFNAERQYGVHGEQPGADMALYLARHDIRVEVAQQTTPEGINVGGALLSLAADSGADLLVMGGYGHQRWREIVLGGVTRSLLQSMTLPVLMAH